MQLAGGRHPAVGRGVPAPSPAWSLTEVMKGNHVFQLCHMKHP